MGEGVMGLLEQEVELLTRLQGLMETEKTCLSEQNGEALFRVAKEKEQIAAQLETLEKEMRSQGATGTSLKHSPGTAELFRHRNELIEDIRDKGQIQEKIVQGQAERTGQLLGFLKNVKSRSSQYDSRGKLRQK